VEGGVDGRQRGDGQVGATGEEAAVAFDRFFVDAFGDDLFVALVCVPLSVVIMLSPRLCFGRSCIRPRPVWGRGPLL
jgi:hypothetical protein